MSDLIIIDIVNSYIEINKEKKNLKKLESLFRFWIILFLFAYRKELKIKGEHLSLLTFLEESRGISQVRKQNSVNNFKRQIKQAIWNILSYLPIKKGYLFTGNKSLFFKLIQRITEQKISRMDPDIDFDKKNDFLAAIHSFCSKDLFIKLKASLPSEFFTREHNQVGFPPVIEGIPISFFGNENIKLLFLSKEVTFIGQQHGGGFGEFRNFRIEEFEKDFSDKYYYWGLGEKNIVQNRFDILDITDREIKYLNILGTTDFSPTYSFLTGFSEESYQETLSNREEYTKKLLKFEIRYMASFKNIHLDHGAPKSVGKHNLFLQENATQKELHSSLFIIDWIGQTFFYQAIYNCIPFILFYDRGWLSNFTNEYKILLSILKEEEFLFFWDEQDSFIQRINLLTKEKQYNSSVFNKARNFFLEKD